jgi:hypothetical protein
VAGPKRHMRLPFCIRAAPVVALCKGRAWGHRVGEGHEAGTWRAGACMHFSSVPWQSCIHSAACSNPRRNTDTLPFEKRTDMHVYARMCMRAHTQTH